MNNLELQAIRRSLFLDVSEAVEHIKTLSGKPLSVRSWQHWEKADTQIPADVQIEMINLAQILMEMMGSGESYEYHRTLADYTGATGDSNVITWRMTQAAAASQILDEIY